MNESMAKQRYIYRTEIVRAIFQIVAVFFLYTIYMDDEWKYFLWIEWWYFPVIVDDGNGHLWLDI